VLWFQSADGVTRGARKQNVLADNDVDDGDAGPLGRILTGRVMA